MMREFPRKRENSQRNNLKLEVFYHLNKRLHLKSVKGAWLAQSVGHDTLRNVKTNGKDLGASRGSKL